jgi:hypothetical protein
VEDGEGGVEVEDRAEEGSRGVGEDRRKDVDWRVGQWRTEGRE